MDASEEIAHGDALAVEVRWAADAETHEFQVAVGLDRIDGVQIFAVDTRSEDLELSGQRDYGLRVEISEQPILRGEYTVHVFLLDENALHVYDHRILTGAVRIAASTEFRVGLIRVPAKLSKLSD